MPVMYYYELRVQGNAGTPFPIDMLRYDRCWPATEEDAGHIHYSLDRRALKDDPTEVVTVALSSWGDRDRQFTPGRWESFGWKLIGIYNRRKI